MTRTRLLVLLGVAGAAAVGTLLYRRRLRPWRRYAPYRPRPRQPLAAGFGPLFFRSYRTAVPGDAACARAAMQRVQADPDAFTPHTVARFEKVHGAPGRMAPGDVYFIHINSPWDGPVAVADVGPDAFSLVTLEGHLEAGHIRFAFETDEQGQRRFVITSCARSRDRLVDLVYDKLGVARQVQEHMWTVFSQRVAAACGAAEAPPVDVLTRRVPYRTEPSDLAAWSRYEAHLAAAAEDAFNFEVLDRAAYTPEAGWHLDDASIELPPEPPGDPVPGGAWERARAWVQAYRFPDPSLIRGYFDPEGPLPGRHMVLRARFLGFAFLFRVRVSEVVDEVRETPDGPARVWGYAYRTLGEHFERGEIFFEVLKHLHTGRVLFRIHAYSQAAPIANPFYRLGFRLFGRHLQRRFHRRALERTKAHVEAALVRAACCDGDERARHLITYPERQAEVET